MPLTLSRPGALALGTALLVSGCGGAGESSTNNAAATFTGAANEFTIGNDASAMEIVGSNSGVAAEMPMGDMSLDNMTMGNMAAPVDPAATNSAAPAGTGGAGGDRGGNSVQSNVSGM